MLLVVCSFIILPYLLSIDVALLGHSSYGPPGYGPPGPVPGALGYGQPRRQHHPYGPPMAAPMQLFTPSPRQSHRHMQVGKEELKSILQDCIDRLSEAKELFTVEKVEKLVLEHFKVCSVINIIFNAPDIKETQTKAVVVFL